MKSNPKAVMPDSNPQPYYECIGCGYCCTLSPCETSRRIYRVNLTECKHLSYDGYKHYCNLTTILNSIGVQYSSEVPLYPGKPCLFPHNPYRNGPLQDRSPRQHKSDPKSEPVPILSSDFQRFLAALAQESTISKTTLVQVLTRYKAMLPEDSKADTMKSVCHILEEQRITVKTK